MPETTRVWTSDELEYLTSARASGVHDLEIARHLERNLSSVRHKARRLGLAYPKWGNARWNAWDVARLQKLYSHCSTQELHEAFPRRSTDAVHTKARKLGLKRPVEPYFPRFTKEQRALRGRIGRYGETVFAYMAGIIDGEGTINRKGRSVTVTVGSITKELIDWLVAKFGGSVQFYPDGTGLGKLPFYRWYLTNTPMVTAILQRCRPYMLIKGHLVP